MKKNRLFLALLAFACTSFFACSSSDDETTDPGVGAETGSDIGDAAGSRFMSVQIINPAGTRAVTDGGYEKGTDNENKVNSLRFYFFNEDGSPITVNATAGAGGDKNFVSATPEPVGENMPNVEKILKATVVINTKQGDNINVKKVVAVANYDIAGLDDAAKSLSDLCAAVGDYSKISITNGETTSNTNFLMTSSSYADASGQVTAVDIKPENLCNSAAAAEANPVNIYIERVVAKVKMDLSWKKSVEKVENVKFGTSTVTAVKMKNAQNEDITVNIDGTTKQLYVV
ncbi:MAG: fimbrial protein, partial [Prevotella sp.]|nr:fimbrial protein [Prevotella sp.]